MKENKVDMLIKVPVELKDWIKGRAKKNMRSMTAEMTMLMREKKEQEEGCKAT